MLSCRRVLWHSNGGLSLLHHRESRITGTGSRSALPSPPQSLISHSPIQSRSVPGSSITLFFLASSPHCISLSPVSYYMALPRSLLLSPRLLPTHSISSIPQRMRNWGRCTCWFFWRASPSPLQGGEVTGSQRKQAGKAAALNPTALQTWVDACRMQREGGGGAGRGSGIAGRNHINH